MTPAAHQGSFYFNLNWAVFPEEMYRDLDGVGFAKNAGIPVDLRGFLRILDPQEVGVDRDKNRSVQVEPEPRQILCHP